MGAPSRPEFVVATLPNGLRWVHQPTASPTGHIGLHLKAGSRDESRDDEGLAHFTEHLIFKGTARRKAFHVLSRLEGVGGELNAYTGKEDTLLYASFMVEHYRRAMDLLFDIVKHASIPEREVPKEREVILDEMDGYKDNPSEALFDEFDALLYPDHPLGMNILGRRETVSRFERADVLRFISALYRPEHAVLSSVGGISVARFARLAEEFGGTWTTEGSAPQRVDAPKPARFDVSIEKEINQSHLVLGGEAPTVHEDDYTAAVLLNNVLGGPAMNSRLNMNIRERHGIAYQIESFINAYVDGGHWGVYAGTDLETVDRAERLIRKELEALRQGMTPRALEQAKLQLLGQMALAQESGQGLMTGLGKSLLVYDRIDRFDELVTKVNSLTVAQLRDVAERMFDSAGISRLRYLGTLSE